MNKTKIDWCDMTWNPVTGCLHGCEYCYARKIANRFGCASETHYNDCVGEECQWITEGTGKIHELHEPVYDVDRGHNAPYPFEFDPTFHRYRLSEPQKTKTPQRIFVCSMADLFGDWVPDEWIQQVFEACEKSPRHKYLVLTKNPKRYRQLAYIPPINLWLGATVGQDKDKDRETINEMAYLSDNFLSAEPLHYDISNIIDYDNIDWVILGQETGNRKDKITPKDSWIKFTVDACRYYNIPIFIKEPLFQRFPIQEYPMGLERCDEN